MEEITEALTRLGYPDRGNRFHVNATWMNVALLLSLRSTCYERRVGAVALDARGFVLATGYNGPPPGVNHCVSGVGGQKPACSAGKLKHNSVLECGAVHAEYNALTRCDMSRVHTVYVTTAPCTECVNLLLASGCKRLFYWQVANKSDLDLWDRARTGHEAGRIIPTLAHDGTLGRIE